MTVAEVQPNALGGAAPAQSSERAPVVNNFCISVATKNGSGSQTANTTLLRALFKMGIPVSGKNVFPSNIQGMPTWYTIRVSKDSYIGRRPNAEIVVAMNPATALEDLQTAEPGGIFMIADDIKIPLNRTDLSYYLIPARKLATENETEPKLRAYVANMVYVGALAQLLGINLDDIEAALMYHFRGKRKPVESNMKVVRLAAEWTATNVKKTDPFRVEKMNKTDGMMMIDGNTAAALGAIYGGVTFAAWYPITPATSVADALNEYLPRLRIDPETKTPTYSIIQAEDELAALGMVIGAGWAGARAMTSTSGPGISLMAEFTGYGYFAEVPAVIWDIQRMGPSTGMPTRVSQGDLLPTYWLGHGDSKHPCLLPGSVYECFEFGWVALDLAERLQTPVFVLSDLDLGMNQWMTKPFDYPDRPLDRGKVLSVADLNRLGVGGFKRYKDTDGDGIAWRTLPGTEHPFASYFTRGTGHNDEARLSERPEDWENNMARLARKFETARTLVPKPVEDRVEGAEVGIIGYGSTDPSIVEARQMLQDKGLKTSYMRVRALPLTDEVTQFIHAYKRVYVVEMNTDGQMFQLLRLHVPESAMSIRACNHSDGMPLTAKWISTAILEKEKK
jgi:2-oxoglutarate ferredoxin oxidoreductase subunit alpha